MSIVLKIAIVSDLHCRHGKKSEITTHLYSEAPENPKKQHPVAALKLLIEEKKLNSDILLCPGDLTDKADEQGLISGWKFVKDISKYLNCRFFTATVGNHDVKSKEEDTKEAKDTQTSNSYDPFHYLMSFVDDYPVDDTTLRDSYWQRNRNFFIYEDDNIILLNFNSSHSHFAPVNTGSSNVTDSILQSIEKELKKHTSRNKVRIALFHHHPKQYANSNQTYKDSDLVERGDELLKLLYRENFDIAIHGHKHIPRLDYSISQMPIFCSGSFSSLMNVKDISGKNTFHLLEIEKVNNTAKGKITTYEFTPGRGWEEITDGKFFPFVTGFGNFLPSSQLVSKIEKHFQDNQLTQQWYTDLIKIFPEIQYLTPEEQERFERELLDQTGLKFLPQLKIGPTLLTKILI